MPIDTVRAACNLTDQILFSFLNPMKDITNLHSVVSKLINPPL